MLLAATAACHSTASAPPATATGPATTVASSSTAVVSTATSATTAVPTSTLAPTTTIATSTSLALVDQVRAAAESYASFYVGCLRAPSSCDVTQFTAEGSDARQSLTRTVGDLRTGGFFVGTEDPGYTVIVSIEPKEDHTLVTTCEWSTMILYGPPATPGGAPIVQNDTHGTTRGARQWVMDGGTWKIRHTDTLSTTTGVNECGPKP